ncbi:transporter substrate-binding domain-containing protein [Paraburkholderia sp. Ac-20336]|uniref:transporter substrate-binding domain-containing protein n=1 Tax=unclassified Paraburkholderia TaxID=2615204 RepID=UPI00141D74AA|nr:MULTISPECIES: transporter substrate-binding domain-containing protein [unclassified Paraburkholderia]MBN3803928.1 transporter substrate-binding domain-containing protein [Paraburkholderia sp. Ac-20336]MBN3846382.1 transporter substrate-binding domain-containing protein [Paraburkholderia sp. Ac-20342]NIF78634.1 transporter substrate-binding domain-containing protein [Paraburkholderia sp. Cy-641]
MAYGLGVKRAGMLACIAALTMSIAPAQAETLHTGVDDTYAPLVFRNLQGQLEGFSIDLGHALEKELGDKIEVEGTQFSALIPALNAKKYDFILGAVTATPERANAMLFSEPYLDSDYLVLQKKGATPITSLAQLKGMRLAVNRGSPYEQWSQENHAKYGFEFNVFPTNADAIQAVVSGRADANMAGVPAQAWAAKHNPLLQSTLLIKTGQAWAFAFRKDDAARRNQISNALKCLKQKGIVAQIAVKWLGFAPDTTKNVYPGEGIPNMPGYDATPVKLSCAK